MPVFLFTKERLYADKPILVGNLPPFKSASGTTKQGRIGNIKRDWDTYRSLAVVTAVGILVEEALSDIGMNTRRAVIH